MIREFGQSEPHRVALTNSKVESLAWSPDADLLAVGTHDGIVRLMRPDGTPLHLIPAFHLGVRNIVFSPDGRWLAAGFRQEPATIWDVITGEPILRMGSGLGIPWAFTHDGSGLVVSDTDRVTLCELTLPNVIRALTGHRSAVARVAWSRDNLRIISLDRSCDVRIWNVAGNVPVDFFQGPRSDEFWADHGAVALSDNGQLAAFATSGENRSRVILRDVATRTKIEDWPLPGGYEEMAAAGDGKFLLVREEIQNDGQNVKTVVRELAPGKPLPKGRILRKSLPGDARRFLEHDLTPDGRLYAWCGPRFPSNMRRVEVHDLHAGYKVYEKKLPPTGGDPSIALSANGQFLWLQGTGPHVVTCNLATGEEQQGAGSVNLSLDGSWIVTNNEPDPRQVRFAYALSQVNERKALIDLLDDGFVPPHRKAIAFSPDGRYLAWGTGRGTLFVADIEALRQEVQQFIERLESR